MEIKRYKNASQFMTEVYQHPNDEVNCTEILSIAQRYHESTPLFHERYLAAIGFNGDNLQHTLLHEKGHLDCAFWRKETEKEWLAWFGDRRQRIRSITCTDSIQRPLFEPQSMDFGAWQFKKAREERIMSMPVGHRVTVSSSYLRNNTEVATATIDSLQNITQYFSNFLTECQIVEPPKLYDSVSHMIRQGEIYVLKEHGEIVSLCAVVATTRYAIRVSVVYTLPNKRIHGFASHLLSTLASTNKLTKSKHIVLHVDQEGPLVDRFYGAIGFKVVGTAVNWIK